MPEFDPEEFLAGGGVTGVASTFADPKDVERYRRARAAGATELEALLFGDNGVGKWGDDTTSETDPILALPSDHPGSQHNRRVLVTGPKGSVVARVADVMPREKNLKGVADVDLNPAATRAIGATGATAVKYKFLDDAFDPVAFLAQEKNGFDPAAFLAQSGAVPNGETAPAASGGDFDPVAFLAANSPATAAPARSPTASPPADPTPSAPSPTGSTAPAPPIEARAAGSNGAGSSWQQELDQASAQQQIEASPPAMSKPEQAARGAAAGALSEGGRWLRAPGAPALAMHMEEGAFDRQPAPTYEEAEAATNRAATALTAKGAQLLEGVPEGFARSLGEITGGIAPYIAAQAGGGLALTLPLLFESGYQAHEDAAQAKGKPISEEQKVAGGALNAVLGLPIAKTVKGVAKLIMPKNSGTIIQDYLLGVWRKAGLKGVEDVLSALESTGKKWTPAAVKATSDTLKAIDKEIKAPLSTAVRKVLMHAAGSAATGGAVTTGHNLIAQSSYDPERSAVEGVPEALTLFGALGAIGATAGAYGGFKTAKAAQDYLRERFAAPEVSVGAAESSPEGLLPSPEQGAPAPSVPSSPDLGAAKSAPTQQAPSAPSGPAPERQSPGSPARQPGGDQPSPPPAQTSGPSKAQPFAQPNEPLQIGNPVISVAGADVEKVPTSAIALRPELMQFKAIEDGQTGTNKADRITAPYDPVKADNLLLWEPSNPQEYGLKANERYIAADGHHRHTAAAEQGVELQNAQILRESAGFSANDARTIAAEKNIAGGKGTIYDQAKFIRNIAATHGPDDALERAGQIGARGRKAATIALASGDDLYASFINEQVTPEQAAAIANTAPRDDGLQRLGIQRAAAGDAPDLISNFLQAVRATTGGSPSEEQADLFGKDDSAIAAAEKAARRARAIQKEIGEQIASVAGATKRPEKARALGVNVEDPEAVQAKLVELQNLRDRAKSWATDDAIRDLAMSGKGTPAEAVKQLQTAQVVDAPTDQLPQKTAQVVEAPTDQLPASPDERLDALYKEFPAQMVDDAIDQYWYEKGIVERLHQTTTSAEKLAKSAGEILTPAQAQARWKVWEKELREIGAARRAENGNKIILSLFDRSGIWAAPFLASGYDVRAIDLATDGIDINNIDKDWLTDYDMTDVHGILAANPCTDFAVSGARWWTEKDADGRTEVSVKLAQHTLAIIEWLKPSFWALENPVGRLDELTGIGKPHLQFHPHNYGDPYTKRTQIWGSFNANLPQANVKPTEGSKAHKLRGDVPEQKDERSKTPAGFALAFAVANSDHGPAARVRQILGKTSEMVAEMKAKNPEPIAPAEPQPIDELIRAGASQEEIEAAIAKRMAAADDQALERKALENGIARGRQIPTEDALALGLTMPEGWTETTVEDPLTDEKSVWWQPPAAPDVQLLERTHAAINDPANGDLFALEQLKDELRLAGEPNAEVLLDFEKRGARGGQIRAMLKTTEWSDGTFSYSHHWDTEWARGGTIYTGRHDSRQEAIDAGRQALIREIEDRSKPYDFTKKQPKPRAGQDKNNRALIERIKGASEQEPPRVQEGGPTLTPEEERVMRIALDPIAGVAIKARGKVHKAEPGELHGELIDRLSNADPEALVSPVDGFVTLSGKFLNRKQALAHAKKIKQLGKIWQQEHIYSKLESQEFRNYRLFEADAGLELGPFPELQEGRRPGIDKPDDPAQLELDLAAGTAGIGTEPIISVRTGADIRRGVEPADAGGAGGVSQPGTSAPSGRSDAGAVELRALAFQRSLIEQHDTAELIGRSGVDSFELAMHLQMYRNPRFETARSIAIDPADDFKIKRVHAVTCNLPGETQIAPGRTMHEAKEWLTENIITPAEANGWIWWMMHNHPSGDPRPSPADHAGEKWARGFLGRHYAGHIIINSGKFAAMQNGDYEIHPIQNSPLHTPEIDHPILGEAIRNGMDAARVLSALKLRENYVSVVMLGNNQLVRAILDVDARLFKERGPLGRPVVENLLEKLGLEYGAREALAYYDGARYQELMKPLTQLVERGYLADALFSAQGTPISHGVKAPKGKWFGKTKGSVPAVTVADQGDFFDEQLDAAERKARIRKPPAKKPEQFDMFAALEPPDLALQGEEGIDFGARQAQAEKEMIDAAERRRKFEAAQQDIPGIVPGREATGPMPVLGYELQKPTEPADDPKFTAFPVNLPEAVRFAHDLLGVAIKVRKKLGNALGTFVHTDGPGGKAEIHLRADIADLLTFEEKQVLRDDAADYARKTADSGDTEADIARAAQARYEFMLDKAYEEAKTKPPVLALKVIWHEIGHAVDWFTDKMIQGRGNLFGHLAALKHKLDHVIALDPTKPAGKPIGEKERRQLFKEAERQLRAEMAPIAEIVETIMIEEPILRVSGITPQDVKNLFGLDARTATPELYKWFAEQPAEVKKEIVRKAMRGALDERLAALGKTEQVGTRTVKRTIRKKVGREPTWEEIAERFQKILLEEIRARNLAQLRAVKEELNGAIAWWHGTDRMPAYFKTATEMYAEAFSIFMNNPAALQKRAPIYSQLLWNYMSARPEVEALYKAVQQKIKAGQVEDDTETAMLESWDRADKESLKLALNKSTNSRDVLDNVVYHLDRRFGPIYRVAKGTTREGQVKQAIGDFLYRMSEHELALTQVNQRVSSPLVRANLDWEDLGRLLFYNRVLNERFNLFNPGGMTSERAINRLKKMEQSLGRQRWQSMEDARKAFREIFEEHVVDPLLESRMFGPELLKQIVANVDYATFEVRQEFPQDGIARLLAMQYGPNITPHIYRQVGTVKEIKNPATATVLKMLSLISANARNTAKRETVRMLREVGSGEIKEAEKRWTGKNWEIIEQNTAEVGTVVYLLDGKPHGWYVRKVMADALNKGNPIENRIALAAVVATSKLQAVLTQWNYAFWPVNFMRDTAGWIMQMPSAGPHDWFKQSRGTLTQAWRLGKGKPAPEAEEALRRRVLISRADPHGVWSAADNEFELKLASYGMNPAAWDKQADRVHLLTKLWNGYRELGQAFERVNKLAAIHYLDEKFPKMPEWKKREIVRERGGSPNFLERGNANPAINFLALFYNPWKEAARSFGKSAKENPISFGAKALTFVLLPTVLMVLAAAGALGPRRKKQYASIPDYDLSNYLCVPLGWADEERSKLLYLRLPLWEPARVLHGTVWQILTGRGQGVATGFYGNAIPGLNPIITSAVQWAQLELAHQNPYDLHRGREILTETQHQAGGWQARQELLKQTWNNLGGSIVHRFANQNLDTPPTSRVERYLAMPVVANALGRWLKVSNRGLDDADRRLTEPLQQYHAQVRLAVQGINKKIMENQPLSDAETTVLRDPYARDYLKRTLPDIMSARGSNLDRRLQNRGTAEKALILSGELAE